jgi:hypothetical protein
MFLTDGITVFDACPSAEAFASFSQSAGFRQALAGAGLPQPQLDPLGEVHDVSVRDEVTP